MKDARLERAREFLKRASGYFGRDGETMKLVNFAASETSELSARLEAVEKENAELRAEVERLREENRLVLSVDDKSNLLECVSDELAFLLGESPDDRIPTKISEAIKEWFQVFGEDQTAGMPEYENHRY